MFPLLAAVVSPGHAAPAVEVSPGVQYPAGTRVGYTPLGLSFVVPDEWFGGVPPGTEAFLLGSNTRPGLVLVLAKHGVDAEGASALLASPLDLGGGISLAPQGAPRREGSVLLQDFAGFAAGQMLSAHTRVVLGGNGTVVAFTVAGPQSDAANQPALARTIAGTLQFSQVAASLAAASKVDWRGRLAGQHLYYLRASGYSSTANTSVEKHLYLCSDGTALWGAESSTLLQGYDSTTSTAGASSDRGRWVITSDMLVVNWGDGSQASYQLSAAPDPREVKLNGDVWFFQGNDRCR